MGRCSRCRYCFYRGYAAASLEAALSLAASLEAALSVDSEAVLSLAAALQTASLEAASGFTPARMAS